MEVPQIIDYLLIKHPNGLELIVTVKLLQHIVEVLLEFIHSLLGGSRETSNHELDVLHLGRVFDHDEFLELVRVAWSQVNHLCELWIFGMLKDSWQVARIAWDIIDVVRLVTECIDEVADDA